ncbi:MAG: T9SS type A sorting domain-containing protein, partial [Bacteroidia bacterium]
TNTATQTITVNTVPAVTVNTSATTICAGQPVTLTGSGASTYSWSGGVTNGLAFTPVSTTTYTVTGTTGGCTNTATQTITVNTVPAVTVNASATTICAGQPVTLTGSGALTYSWTSGVSDGVAFTPVSTATYTVTGTASGCTNTATQTITVNPVPSVTVNTTATTICAGQPVTLTGSGASTYSWTSGVSDGVAFTPVSTNTYTVTGTASGCTNTAAQTITVNPVPSVTANASSTALCPGQLVTLTGGGATSYSWTGGAVDGIAFVPTSSATYTVTGTSLSCSNTATVVVTVIVIDTSVTQAGNVLTANSSTATYQWVDCNNSYLPVSGETNQSFTPSIDGSYAVIINESGCVDTSSCFLVISTGLRNTLSEEIGIYPNPSTGMLYFNLGKENKLLIEIYNTIGQKIKTQEVTTLNNKINLEDNYSGTYLLKIQYGNEVLMKRLILVK